MSVRSDIADMRAGQLAGIAFLRRSGRGIPLVLLHGIGSNATSFTQVMAALPEHYDVTAWNAPGYANSEEIAVATPTPRHYAAALARLFDALQIEHAVLAGHSLGCLFAGAFAGEKPERVKTLALLSPALGYKTKCGEPLPPTVQARIDEIRSLGPQTFAERRAARLVHEAGRKPQVLAAVRDAMARVDQAGYVQAARALGAGDLLADVARIAAPTFVVVGSEDLITSPSNARAAFEAARNPAGYFEVPGAGHALPQENPGAVAKLLGRIMGASRG